MEVGACHYGFCDPLAMDIARTWVIVDWLTKSAHFLAVRMTFKLEEFCRLYIREIVQLHGVLVDWLTKSAHFLAMRMTFTLEEFYK